MFVRRITRGIALRALALTCAILCAAIPRGSSAAPPLFGPRLDFRTGNGPLGVVSADFNRDSIPDLFIADYRINHLGTTASILLGNGDGTFRERTTVPTALGIAYLSAGDLNEDGVTDVIALNQGVGDFVVDTTTWAVPPISIFLGLGDGTFRPRVDYGHLPEFRDSKVTTVADMNGDGHLDVVMGIADVWVAADMANTTTAGSTTVTDSNNRFTSRLVGTWLTNRGNPDPTLVGIAPATFVVSVESPGSLTISQPATASGSPVIRYMDVGPNYVNIWSGNGDGTLSPPTSTIDAGIGASAVAVGDVNGDGYPDIATTNFASSRFAWMQSAIQLMIANGDGTFRPPVSFPTPRLQNDLKIADVNGDGHLDFVTTNWIYNSLSILPGDGHGAFGSSTELPTAGQATQVEVVDFNGDGIMDLATTASTQSTMLSVFLGTGGGAFGSRLDFPTANATRAFFARDLNRDGRIDLAVTDFGNALVSVFLNTGCQFQDAITGVFPSRGGNGGDLTTSIYGCDLDPTARVSLSRPGEADIQGVTRGVLEDGGLDVLFDLRGGALGLWNVVLTRPGLPDAIRPDGFTIEEARPTLIWAEWSGPAAHREGRQFDNEIFGGNLGNNDPNGIGSAQTSLAPRAAQNPQKIDDCNKEYTWSFICPTDPVCTNSMDMYKMACDKPASSATVEGSAQVTVASVAEFDAIKVGMAVTGSGIPWGTIVTSKSFPTLTLSKPAEATATRTLKYAKPVDRFTPPSTMGCFTLPQDIPSDFTVQSFYRGSALVENFTEDAKRCVNLFQAKGKGADHPGHVIVDKYGLLYRFWDLHIDKTIAPWPGDITDLANNVRVELCELLNTFEKCDSLGLAKTDVLIIEAVLNALKKLDAADAGVIAYKKILDEIYKQRTTFHAELGAISSDINNKALRDSLSYAKVVPDSWNKGPLCQQHICNHPGDPNAKVGPAGVGVRAALVSHAPLHYTIYFENAETETFSASEVSVTDRLDPLKVDFGTFRFGRITFGDRVVTPAPGLSPYRTEVDLRPAQNLKVRIIAQLDEATGRLTFRFQSLDPVTGLDPTDQTLGFLPPNVHPPQGEGSVSFTLMPRSDLLMDAEIRNRASIVFDTNDPIPTNEWVNTIDVTKPSSHVNALTPVPGQETRIVAHWVGDDGPLGSGIADYSIYVSDNGAPYALWTETSAQQDTFPGQDGHTYGFYSIARDLVGFEENPPAPLVADATIQVVSCSVVMGFDFTPGTLNLRSMGHWVTGYLEPPAPFTPADIDSASIRLNGTVKVDSTATIAIGDHDGDGIPDLMVRFNRRAVDLTVSAGDSVPVTVKGTVGGQCFHGTDYIRVLRAKVTAPAAGAALSPGATTAVRWETPNGIHVESVALLSSIDDGGTWSLEASDQPNTGSYDWMVPNVSTNEARVAVVLVESSDETGDLVEGVLGTSGTFSIGNVTGVDGGAKVEFALRVVRPNPSVANLQVSFGLPEARPAKIEVFNVSGRLVASREVGSLGVGFHTVMLSGRGTLPSGVYLVRLTQGGRSLTTRAVIVR
jgi:VCBS repeat protein